MASTPVDSVSVDLDRYIVGKSYHGITCTVPRMGVLPILETAQVPTGFLLLLSATAHPQFDAAASACNAPNSALLLVLLLPSAYVSA